MGHPATTPRSPARAALVVLLAAAAVACGGTASPVGPDAVTASCAAANISGDPNVSLPPRCVRFADFDWIVKAGRRIAPGPNTFSDSADNVWVDAAGLHMRLTGRDGAWSAAEVFLARPLGYGRYEIRTSSRLDLLDPNVVFALFTYNYPDSSFGYREMDIEFSPRISRTGTAQFAVQADRRARFSFAAAADVEVAHVIDWRADRVEFASGGTRWTYAGAGIPPPGGEHLRINLWLFGGTPPASGVGAEVVVTGFRFVP